MSNYLGIITIIMMPKNMNGRLGYITYVITDLPSSR